MKVLILKNFILDKLMLIKYNKVNKFGIGKLYEQ